MKKSLQRILYLLSGVLLAIISAASFSATSAEPALQQVRVISFDGGWNLPVWAAQRQGFFKQNGVDVTLTYTPNSVYLVEGLLHNRYDIAIAGIDNLIAYQEGQGEIEVKNPDLFAFMGYDNGFLGLITAPQIKTIADLKGKTVSVDAMNTGFAFVLREMLAKGGVTEDQVTFVSVGSTGMRYEALLAGKQDGTLLRTPFTLLAKDKGFNEVGTAASVLGAYQGSAAIARRSWAKQHETALIGYMRGYRAGVEWLYDPKNRPVAEALLIANIPDMTPELAKQSYDLLFAPKGGMFKDSALDMQGIATVLMLRNKYATPKKTLQDPAKYVDMSYYQKAFSQK